jgi:hypothetical protein
VTLNAGRINALLTMAADLPRAGGPVMACSDAATASSLRPRPERAVESGFKLGLKDVYADVVREPAPVEHIQAILRLRQREREKALAQG